MTVSNGTATTIPDTNSPADPATKNGPVLLDLLTWWKTALGLSDWKISIQDRTKEGEELGCVNVRNDERVAHVIINTGTHAKQDDWEYPITMHWDNIEATLVHELLHIVLWPMTNATIHDWAPSQHHLWTGIYEKVNNNLVDVLVAFRRMLPPEAPPPVIGITKFVST